MGNEDTRPIFMIGTGRCGSTLAYEALSLHDDLGWMSNYNSKCPRHPGVSALSRIYDLPGFANIRATAEKRQASQGKGALNKYYPRPDECWPVWRSLCGEKFARSYLLGERATDQDRHAVRSYFDKLLSFRGKKRLLVKLTGPPRIEYVRSLFPDAIFVHVVRDGRAVVNSVITNPGWNWLIDGEPRWSGGLTAEWKQEWQDAGSSHEALTAIQYRALLSAYYRERSQLAEDEYIDLEYEDFVKDPVAAMRGVLSFCGLSEADAVLGRVAARGKYKDMNKKFMENFSPDKLALIESILGHSNGPLRERSSEFGQPAAA
jgi:hypothetical protein